MYGEKSVAVLIAAAGIGERFGSSEPKQFLNLGDQTLLDKSIEAFENNSSVDDIYIVTQKEYISKTEKLSYSKIRQVICGGDTRQESVYNGLKYINSITDKKADMVLIHDAVRPYVTGELTDRVIRSAFLNKAAVPAIPVNDTVKITKGDRILSTPDRSTLYSAQTPQGFELDLIIKAHENAVRNNITGTDDAMLTEVLGAPVYIVDGDVTNKKITYPDDIPEKDSPVGLGFDVHAFADDRDLILGGYNIPYKKGLQGHSDADVLIHALMDAILGALDLGDIGTNFPDTDDSYKGISSTILLQKVTDMMNGKGYTIGNVDLIIVAEKPKMQDHIPFMKKTLAGILGVDSDRISIKATTTEGLGFTGREEGIGAQAIVQLYKSLDH